MQSLYIYPNQNNALLTWRRESLSGKDYIVAQGVPLVEGVLNGRFVSAEAFGAFVNDWNGVPIVMRHPKQNGGSARVPEPDVPVIGHFYGAKLDGARLTGEYWLEADKLEGPDGKMILSRLSTQKPSETSTGYWAESVPSVGDWNGREFAFVDQNIHPDHIALLPDEIGACSLQDGCGMNRNSRMTKQNIEHPWHEGRPGEVGGSRSDEGGVSSETASTARSLSTKADQATKRAMQSGDPKDHAAARDAHAKAAEMNFQAYYEIKKEDPEAAAGFRRAVLDHERTAETHNKHAGKLQQNVTGLTGSAAELWEEVHQSYLDKDKSEERAAQAAWAAVKSAGWEKNDKGEWVKKNQLNSLGITPQELEGLASLAAFVAN